MLQKVDLKSEKLDFFVGMKTSSPTHLLAGLHAKTEPERPQLPGATAREGHRKSSLTQSRVYIRYTMSNSTWDLNRSQLISGGPGPQGMGGRGQHSKGLGLFGDLITNY